MILGPPDIIHCPHCNAIYQSQSLISGNTFGGMHFSDGQHHYPMLPSHPELTVCDACSNFFWVKELKSQENMRDFEGEDDPPFIRWPEQGEWVSALEKGIYRNEKEEIYIRTHLWWVLNNWFRSEGRLPARKMEFPEKLYNENLIALLRLKLSEPEPDFLIIAEMHRELGFFEKALEFLDKADKMDYPKELIRQIREKAKTENPFMFRLN